MTDGGQASRRMVPIVLILAVGAFMQTLDASILLTAIPQMARGFEVSPIALGAGITSYIMATAIVLPACGWLADRIGARRLLVWSLLGFTVASVLCAMSRTLPQFIGARLLQGAAGAALMPVGSIIMMRLSDKRDLIRMVNIFSAPILVAPVLGPPIGGMLTTLLGWQWIFYLNLPVGVIGALLALRYIPPQPRVARPFDLAGFVLNGLALGLLIFGVGELGAGGMPVAGALALIALGAVIGALALGHARRHSHPLVSAAPLANATFTLTSVYAMPLMRLPISALPFALPIMLQVGFGMSAFMSGMLFLAHTGGDLSVKVLAGRVFARFGYRSTLAATTLAFALGTAACALVRPDTSLVLLGLVLCASGMVRSFQMSGTGTLSYAEIGPAEMPSATTLNMVVSHLGQAVAISLTSLLMELSILWRHGAPGVITADDCRVALLALAAASLLALWPILRLRRDAGVEVSGFGAE